MEFIKADPIEIGLFHWQLRPPRASLTLVCKLSFDIVPDGVCTLSEEPFPVSGDIHLAEDDKQCLVYASDLAVSKVRGECTLSGTCHPPRIPATTSAVSFRFGDLHKSLAVFGDRQWKKLGLQIGDPEPFESMPLNWSRSSGGPKSPLNPHGRSSTDEPLPNLEDPAQLITGASPQNPPAGCFPIDPAASIRRRFAGTYDEQWKKKRWPYFPEDFELEYFQHAPLDQRIPGFWRGDEALSLQNLNQKRSTIKSQLPGLLPRLFLQPSSTPPGETILQASQEVPLLLDTVHIDADAGEFGRVYCVWRGLREYASSSPESYDSAFAFLDPRETPRSFVSVQTLFTGLLEDKAQAEEDHEAEAIPELEPPSEPPPEPEAIEAPLSELPRGADGQAIRDPAELKALYLSAGVPMPDVVWRYVQAIEARKTARAEAELQAPKASEPTKPTGPSSRIIPSPRPEVREQVEAALADGIPLAGMDLSGGILHDLDLRGRDLSGALLDGADLSRALLDDAKLDGATLLGARFEKASLKKASLGEAECSLADFREADLSGASLAGAFGEDASFVGAKLEDAKLDQAELPRADFRQAKLDRASLDEADLSGAKLESARLRQCSLVDANLERVQAPKIDLLGADLSQLRGSGGADFSEAEMRECKAVGARFFGSKLDGANLSFIELDEANLAGASCVGTLFHGSSLQSARFAQANLREAGFVKANLFEATFEEASLLGADLRGANAFGAQFWKADLRGTLLEEANLGRSLVKKA